MTTGQDGAWTGSGIDVRLLRYFLAVADELHFTRAAQRLYVSQPALSNQIKRLEHQLGVALFRRSQHGVALTAAGAAFRPYAREALASLQTGIARAAEAAGRATVLRIDVIDTALAMPRTVLSRLRSQHPDLPLHVTALGSAGQRQRILAGDLDVGFCGAGAVTGEHIDHEVVRYEPIDVVLPAGHPLASADAVPLRALADDVFSLPHDDVAPEWNDHILRACHDAGFAPRRHPTSTDGADTALDLVREGGCVALGLRSTSHPDGTVVRPLAEPGLTYPWAIIWRRDDPGVGISHLRQAAREVAAMSANEVAAVG